MQSLATLGQVDSHGGQRKAWDLWEVTKEDVANGYDASLMFARIGWEALALDGGSAGAKAAGFLGKAGRALMWADTARNVTMGVDGVNDIRKNGLTWENGLKVLGFAGARGNLSILNQAGKGGKVGRGVVAAEQFVANSAVGRTVGTVLTRTHGVIEKGLSTAIHGVLPNIPVLNKLHNPVSWAVNKLGFKVCFSGRTKLLARGKWGKGYRRIDELTLDDQVASRDEYDPNGVIEWKPVEEIFVRSGFLLNVRLGHALNGNGEAIVIETTSEHPFFEIEKGWTAADALKPGDRIRTDNGWQEVEEVYHSGNYETVYNLRVADWHTYFVGDAEWGFAVWAHNAAYGSNNPKIRSKSEIGQEAHRQIEKDLRLQGFETEVPMTLKGGRSVRKDAVLGDEVVIIKPNTDTGRRSAAKRAELMEDAGKDVTVFYYDPTNPAYLPGSPTYIGPRKR